MFTLFYPIDYVFEVGTVYNIRFYNKLILALMIIVSFFVVSNQCLIFYVFDDAIYSKHYKILCELKSIITVVSIACTS